MKKKLILCQVFCLNILLLGCSFQNDSFRKSSAVKNIVDNVDYNMLVTQGYMGGSLIYNEKNLNLGQLDNNISVAIRLCKLISKDVGDGRFVYKEQDNSYSYGLLYIKNIDNNSLIFSVKSYSTQGSEYTEKEYTLYENEVIDINEDGIYDLEYKKPLFERKGYENCRYLNFLSSREDLNATMYAVLVEQYPGNKYPNGIIGVNNDGRFIIQKYSDITNSKRNAVQGIYPGDYVVDNLKGNYQSFRSNRYQRNARVVTDEDLQDFEEIISDEDYYFTEADFAFTDLTDFVNSLPNEISDFIDANNIENLNKLLEYNQLVKIIDESQGSILPNENKDEIVAQLKDLTTIQAVKFNRVFLEKNYPYTCPQRLTVSQAIPEILPLCSVAITEEDLNQDVVEKIKSNKSSINNLPSQSQRAASASWTGASDLNDYKKKLCALESQYSSYLTFLSFPIEIPVTKQSEKNDGALLTTKLKVTDSNISLGIKGTFNCTYGNIDTSLGVAVFFKAGAGIGLNIQRYDTTINKVNDYLEYKYDSKGEEKNDTVAIKAPIFKKDVVLLQYEKDMSQRLCTFTIGPVVIGINLNFGIGIPIKLNFEVDGDILYDAYIAGLAQAGISIGLNYGVNFQKVWFFNVPIPYFNFYGDKSASADAIFFIDVNKDYVALRLNSLTVGFSITPYIKLGLDISVNSIASVGADFSIGAEGYVKFGIENPKLIGKYGLNLKSKVNLNAFLGFTGLKILCFKLGKVGFNWNWNVLDFTYPIIKETNFFEEIIKK